IWGSVSYYKSTEIRLEARKPPEQIVADGSHVEDPVLIQDIEGDATQRETPIEAEKVKTEEAVSNLPVKAAKAAPTKTVKKTVAQKNVKSKMAGSKNSGRQQKKLKKSLAAKPAS
ncbi:MAG: hypothetical protein M3Q07_16400, partial [Pseudobdellovibrionaceae bacterium]|nr:hypothetical protein [Pseudobdellovibrionaceae bacterium]